LSAVTSKIQIRAGSVVIPLQDPIRVAEEWATLDHLSRGRAGLAFASGWHADDFVLAPEDYTDRRAAMLLGIETVQKLWRGETIRRKNGVGREIEVRIYPVPVQSAIPIWLTAAGNVTTFQEAGKRGYRVLTHLLGQSVAELGEKIAAYRQAYREAGHAGEGYVTLMVHYFLGRDLQEVHRRVRRPFLNYLRSSVDLTARLADQHGLDARKLSPDDINALLEHGYDRYVEKSALIGTPDSCRALFDQLCELGVDEMAGLVDFGLATEDVLTSLELFPELRDGKSTWDTQDESFAGQIVRHSVTHLQCTPSLARLLLDDSHTRAALGRLREFLVGGEELPLPLAKELADVVPGAVRNMYGPTETTVWSSSFQVPAGCSAVRIGSPLANSRIYVLDPQGQLAPIGVIGEIIIGGTAVTRGYHQRPDLTAQRFIDDPFVPGARAYRTGDLGRMRADGTLEFLGRRDSQIKLRGHRIELGDIEAALRKCPGVLEAATTVHPDAAGEPRLCAYVVPAMANMDQLAPQATTEHLSTWQTLWERTYSEPRKNDEDGRFWTAGWISSLTGEMIAASAMQDWVDNTVARIRSYHPKRVLEIGCGSGLLLFKIAPHCDHYLAQDFSRAVLDHVRDQAQQHDLRQITLVEAPANTLEHVPRESVDMVVVNSVIQYFPSTDYLVDVLEQAVERVRDGGHVFVGDVRDARLLRAQLATTLMHRAIRENPQAPVRTLQRDLERRVTEEEELLLEPAFFAVVKNRIPRIKALHILRKTSQFDTEMARFRYDVILEIGSSEATPASKSERPWGDLTLDSLRSLLTSVDVLPLVLRDVPDARLAGPAHHAKTLTHADTQQMSVQELQAASLAIEAIDMEKLRIIALKAGLSVAVSPPISGAEDRSDITFWNSTAMPEIESWSEVAKSQSLASLANNPLRAKQMRTLVPLIREYVRNQLPDYMLPSTFVLLDALPRTPNGKIARRALPPPEQAAGSRKREHVPPQTPTEIKLADVWMRVLGVERLSAEDNFFDLGGHSFSAAQLVFYIRETFQRELALGALFAAPTLSAMARAIDSKTN
jgi:natural product biosynthesis luciferase-like monooxygenase protein